MIDALKWFFSSPTPVVAVLSFLIAYSTYLYQRKWNRKQKAHQISVWYGKVAIPKSRYIKRIFQKIGVSTYANKFTEIRHFTSNELKNNLEKADCTEEEFISKFELITEELLDDAYRHSGCGEDIHKSHTLLKEALDANGKLEYAVFNRFIIDFLNELETVALQINCNIAEGSLIYPILHQSFLWGIKSWYFFIAKENQFDHNRFYPNVIALYLSWDAKAKEDEDNYNKTASKKNALRKI